ncbi:MAG: peptidoglycan-associated lipoprotein Pal [Pseudomonadota bacterium]
MLILKRGSTIFTLIACLFLVAACARNRAPEPPQEVQPVQNQVTRPEIPDNTVATERLDTQRGPLSQSDLIAAAGADRVFFAFDSHTLDGESRSTLRRQAAWLRANPEVSIVVEGHCDERGTREYNIALGMRRASSVRDFLVASGVEANRVRTISYGAERPAATGSGDFVWRQNRRGVTIVS